MAKEKILRHSGLVRLVHWSIALSTFTLIITGMFQLPLARRYFIDQLPGLFWTGDYSITVLVHYIAAAILLSAVSVHVVYHVIRKEYNLIPRKGDMKESYQIIKSMFGFCEEPKSDKYLAEQRLAYAYMAFSFLLILVTGVLKVIKNFPTMQFSETFLSWVTNIHNLATFMIIFGIFAHLAAFAIKANWPLLPSMFTGKVDLEYAKHRHSIWCIKGVGQKEKK
ncbi:MAG: membrane protein [Peptococcaceae bacterium BICA1-8]|nr:MAG: membrane protein [Peptococcaceae bacterium BICA1-8]